MHLKDKIAIVTGGSRGIGKEICLTCAREGAKIIVNYVNFGDNKKIAEATKSELEAIGATVMLAQANVASFEETETMFKEIIKEFGRIDVLVNNAGITKDNFLVRMSEDQWDAVIDVNLKGVFNMTQAVAPVMTKNKSGSIITLSSVVGVYGNACQTNYAATKGGVISMSKSWAKELTRKGAQVRANCIAPGFISSAMTDALPEEVVAKMLERTPLGRLGTVDDIANTALFLASDESSYITGQVIEVTGGMTL